MKHRERVHQRAVVVQVLLTQECVYVHVHHCSCALDMLRGNQVTECLKHSESLNKFSLENTEVKAGICVELVS